MGRLRQHLARRRRLHGGRNARGQVRAQQLHRLSQRQTRDFDLKLQMKIEKGGGGGIQYRSDTARTVDTTAARRPAAV
jgi:hypothetical protein